MVLQPVLLGLQQLVDLHNQLHEFLRILLIRSLCTKLHPLLSVLFHFAPALEGKALIPYEVMISVFDVRHCVVSDYDRRLLWKRKMQGGLRRSFLPAQRWQCGTTRLVVLLQKPVGGAQKAVALQFVRFLECPPHHLQPFCQVELLHL
jgi:hypothetical protein